MKIILTDHAKERMVVRKITEKMIKEAIAKPDSEGFGYQNRLLVFKSFSGGVIKVVYSKEKNYHIIISVIWENRK
jgi:hypothetical protein